MFDQNHVDLSLLSPMDLGDLAPVEIEVKVSGVRYVLREASEAAAAAFQNANMRAARMEDGKVVGLNEGTMDSRAALVAACLCMTDSEGKVRTHNNLPVTVPVNIVRGWPARVIGPLFDRVQAISKLTPEETEESLTKQIAELTAKRDKLRKAKAPEGNSPPPGATT